MILDTGRFPFSPNFRKFRLESNGMGHLGSVRPEYLGPPFKVLHCNQCGHFGRSDQNVPFHLTKLLSPVPLFCIPLTRTITKRDVAWVGSVQPECGILCCEFLVISLGPKFLNVFLVSKNRTWKALNKVGNHF